MKNIINFFNYEKKFEIIVIEVIGLVREEVF